MEIRDNNIIGPEILAVLFGMEWVLENILKVSIVLGHFIFLIMFGNKTAKIKKIINIFKVINDV